MSAAKVIFTYKRKRLSSRSVVGQEDGCADFSLDASNKKIKNTEKDMMILNCANHDDMDCLEPSDNQHIHCQLQHVCCGEKKPAACSSPALPNSSRLEEKYDVQRSDTTNVRNMVPGSNELSGDNTFKISGKRVSAEASLEETTSSIEKDFCSLHSSYLDVEGCVQGGSVSQSTEKDSNSLPNQEYLKKNKVAKGQSNAPLLTFSRRLKRKANMCGTSMFMKLLHGKGEAASRECDSSVLSCMCDGMSRESSLIENSVDVKVEKSDADMRNMLHQSSEKMTSNEIGDPSCPCRQPSAETLIFRHMEVASHPREDLVVDASPVYKQTAVMTSGSIDSALDNPGTVGFTSINKDDVRCSSYDGTLVSSCNIACKTGDQPVSQQLRACSGDSQLTSSDSSDLKIGAAKRVEHGARSNSFDLCCPPPGACVIDCNVVPESDVQEDTSDIIQDSSMVKNCEKVRQMGHTKSKGLELFGYYTVEVEDSPDGACTPIKTKNKPETKFLQLFSEDENCCQFTPPNKFSEDGHSKVHHNAGSTLDSQRHKVDQPSSKALPVLGLSLPSEPIHEGQTSQDGPTANQFQNHDVRACNLIQNPAVQCFPNQSSFRHKQLLKSINTRATSLRGNISLDKFEPCPAMWSEEELDSLWIGIRRHGRGNWHAMLLDPRLRFAPWRVAGDLEDQWEREQQMLFSGKPMPSSTYLKPQDAYKLHCHSPVACHGTGGRRENFAAETHLSLGNVYAQNDSVSLQSSAPRNGITRSQRHVTMAGRSAVSYGCGPFNNFQANVMIRGEVSPNGSAVAFGVNNCLPHLFRDPIIIPSRPLDSPLPPISTLPQMGGFQLVHAFPDISGTSCRGKDVINTKLDEVQHSPGHLQCGGPLIGKPGTADNLIVIDSDASSEETISDDKNVRS